MPISGAVHTPFSERCPVFQRRTKFYYGPTTEIFLNRPLTSTQGRLTFTSGMFITQTNTITKEIKFGTLGNMT